MLYLLNPFNPFRKPTPRQMLTRQLEDAKRWRITSAATAEEHAANVKMLDARIARIQREIQAMTPNPQ